jgi:phospholipid/cholesterol/gamma-HCH transport system substrate-binding protein
MTISKEVRIGLLVTVAVVLFFIGFYFLKGANLFSNTYSYYCVYPDVDGLQNSANVQVNGLNVGHVTHMNLIEGQRIKVEININRTIQLPEGTVATLTSSDLLGAKVIQLVPGNGPGVVQPNGTIPSRADASLTDKLGEELTPRLRELKNTIVLLDSALRGVNGLLSTDNQRAISGAIQSIKATSDNLSQMSKTLSAETGDLTAIVRNTNSFTANLAKSNDTIQHILSNASNVSRQMANAPIQRTLTDLQKTTDQLQGIVNKVNNGQGSLGMLINNKDLYNNLNGSVTSLRNLTEDLKANPGRYLNFSVFGGSKKSNKVQK